MPAYVVFHDATLREIVTQRPTSLDALGGISGVGATLERHGPGLGRAERRHRAGLSGRSPHGVTGPAERAGAARTMGGSRLTTRRFGDEADPNGTGRWTDDTVSVP